MQINFTELLNVIIALALFGLALRDKINGYLIALFAYGSLYFSHTAFLLVSGAPLTDISNMHATGQGAGILAKVSTMIFLTAIISQPINHIYKNKLHNVNLIYIFSVALLFISLGYYFNIRSGDWLQVQNVISIQVMLLLILLGYTASGKNSFERLTERKIIAGRIVFLAVAVAVAAYELFSDRAWSGTLYASGLRANRASSIFYNPNLYAFWAALIYLIFSFFYHNTVKHRFWIYTGMLLSAVSICLSGGRSSALILFLILVGLGLAVKGRHIEYRWAPLVVLIIFFVFLYLLSLTALKIGFSGQIGWQSLILLVERIAVAPFEVMKYIFYKLSLELGPFSISNGVYSVSSEDVSPQIAESIEGRLTSTNSDSSYITLFKDAGWLGLGTLIASWIVLITLSVRKILININVFSIYSFCVLIYFILSGFSMRFQVFPVWLFVGVGLVPCLIYWRKSKAI
jgi:hypothetical protein